MDKDFKDSVDRDIEDFRRKSYSELVRKSKYNDNRLEDEMLDLKFKVSIILIVGVVLLLLVGLFLNSFV